MQTFTRDKNQILTQWKWKSEKMEFETNCFNNTTFLINFQRNILTSTEKKNGRILQQKSFRFLTDFDQIKCS